jgi:hypothetical protein
MKYRPERFSSTYDGTNGKEIWAFLIKLENMVRMETATYLSRPAAEALSPQLFAEFGEEIKLDRMKQMVGHMIRQIMESRGYQVDRGNVRISNPDNIFSSATRYTFPKS